METGGPRAKRVAHAVFRPGLDHAARLDACRAVEVDMIEIDVLGPPHHAGLVVAHDGTELRSGRAIGFEAALDLVEGAGAPPFGLNVDLKTVGYEDAVVAILRERGLLARSIISTMEEPTLRRVRELDPAARIGWSVPRVRRDPFRSPFTAVPAYGMVKVLRRTLPRKAAAAVRAGRVDAIMANQHVVTGALVRAVTDAGGEVYVWTVDDADRIAELEALGVSAVITNKPELFVAQPTTSQVAAE